MNTTIFAAAVLLLAVQIAGVQSQSASSDAPDKARLTSPATTAPKAVIDRYCVTCHNQRTRAGNLALDTLDVSAIGRDANPGAPAARSERGGVEMWEKVVRKVRTGMMPPSGAPRPRCRPTSR